MCASGQMATNLFVDDLENPGSGNWTAQPGGDWYYSQATNPTVSTATYATSGVGNLWGNDRSTLGDYSIAMNQSVAIPSGSTAYLRFNHAYGFEDDAFGGYDGGMLEYSTNGGASYSDIGSRLTDGGYNGTLSTASNNPLEGRSAFVRESNGYISSRASLSSLGGQSVRFRFRIGTDSSVDDYGWFVDDIRIYTCASSPSPTPSPTPTPTPSPTPTHRPRRRRLTRTAMERWTRATTARRSSTPARPTSTETASATPATPTATTTAPRTSATPVRRSRPRLQAGARRLEAVAARRTETATSAAVARPAEAAGRRGWWHGRSRRARCAACA